MEKQERKQKKLLTENRLVTINKRETSFEGLVQSFENGEDRVYGLFNKEDDKHTIFQPKVTITQKDVDEVPSLRELRSSIKKWETLLKKLSGRPAYIAKKAVIDMRKDQYVLKEAWRCPIQIKGEMSTKPVIALNCEEWIGETGSVMYEGASLMNPAVCKAVLADYSHLKEEAWGNFEGDLWYFLEDFDRVADRALKDYPAYEMIVEQKIDGRTNQQIQHDLQSQYGLSHSAEYISSLWCNKIPTLIASAAEDEFLEWYYLTQDYGEYKKCNRCGEIKLANSKYFSRNNTSKDHFYSICKECRKKSGKKD